MKQFILKVQYSDGIREYCFSTARFDYLAEEFAYVKKAGRPVEAHLEFNDGTKSDLTDFLNLVAPHVSS